MGKKLTKKGFKKLKKELKYLKNDKKKEIAQRLKKAAAFGDLSENSAYDDAKEAKSALTARIMELENILENAEIVEKDKNINKVQVGSIVTLEVIAKNKDHKEKYEIVGAEESDPLEGKISYESPLGEKLTDKKVGDVVEINKGTNKFKYKIEKVE